jgi:hypothetical protein
MVPTGSERPPLREGPAKTEVLACNGCQYLSQYVNKTDVYPWCDRVSREVLSIGIIEEIVIPVPDWCPYLEMVSTS